jgi:putative YhdH/YhfP family quinone oxidoreductase
MFKAILINKQDNAYTARVADVNETDLPDAAVTVRVEYSTVNYKDGLAITGKSPVVRKFPMVPGIDFAGVVEASSSAAWKAGDRVLLNGWGVGEGHWGGLAQKARVNAELLQRIPAAFTAKQTMAIGQTRCEAGARRSAGYRRFRWRWQRCHRLVGESRFQRCCLDGQGQRSRLPQSTRRQDHH